MRILPILFVILLLMAFSHPVYAGIRCDGDIISVGDTTSEVIMKLGACGEILYKEYVREETIVVSNDKKKNNRAEHEKVKKEILVEVWHIRVKERGGSYCYPLTIKNGCLHSIGDWNKCD